MALKATNRKEIIKYLADQSVLIERALIFNLEAFVRELQNHAKLSKGYEDQTSNLKGSIGGVVLKDGKPVSFKGFDAGGKQGNTTGTDFINSLITKAPKGYVIIIVAGMEYATYVEDIYNKNVLKRTELKMTRELPLLLNKLKARFK